MICKYLIGPFLSILVKLKLLQNGNTLRDHGFTFIWTVVGLILPASMIYVSKDEVIRAYTKKEILTIWNLITKPLCLWLLVPAICIIGKFNPQLMMKDVPKFLPAKSTFLLFCLCEIWILHVQSLVATSMKKTCHGTESCLPLVVEILFLTQSCIYESLSVALVGICSGQVIGTLEKDIDKAALHSQSNLFKQTKQSLSGMLFVYLSFTIIDCMIETYTFILNIEIENGIRVVYASSLVIYFCLALDDCYVAFKEYISNLRYGFDIYSLTTIFYSYLQM